MAWTFWDRPCPAENDEEMIMGADTLLDASRLGHRPD